MCSLSPTGAPKERRGGTCSFRAFLALNRCVRKGERAIWILAPITIRDRHADDDRDSEGEGEGRRTFVRSVPMFDTLSRDVQRQSHACGRNP